MLAPDIDIRLKACTTLWLLLKHGESIGHFYRKILSDCIQSIYNLCLLTDIFNQPYEIHR
jgi:hypothetical protein